LDERRLDERRLELRLELRLDERRLELRLDERRLEERRLGLSSGPSIKSKSFVGTL
jgi:hypothetical protein